MFIWMFIWKLRKSAEKGKNVIKQKCVIRWFTSENLGEKNEKHFRKSPYFFVIGWFTSENSSKIMKNILNFC